MWRQQAGDCLHGGVEQRTVQSGEQRVQRGSHGACHVSRRLPCVTAARLPCVTAPAMCHGGFRVSRRLPCILCVTAPWWAMVGKAPRASSRQALPLAAPSGAAPSGPARGMYTVHASSGARRCARGARRPRRGGCAGARRTAEPPTLKHCREGREGRGGGVRCLGGAGRGRGQEEIRGIRGR